MIYKESELIESINQKNIENFNKNGGTSMYIYKVPGKSESASEKESVLEKIKEIDAKYSTQEYTPAEIKSLGLEEMTYERPTDEDIEESAISSLGIDKEASLKEIEDKYVPKFSGLTEKAEKALEDKEEDASLLDSKYDSLIKKTTDTSIKRGLSRSSIYENALKEIEDYKESQLSVIDQEYQKAVNKLENEKSILEQQKESALSSFDISYAVKLQNKIASINNEIAKEQEKVLKFNNDIAKKEAAYIAEQEKAETKEKERIDKRNKELLDLINKKGLTEVNKIKAQEKYDIILNYLSGLSKSEALKELQNDSAYENELGSYYTLLYAKMINRKD